MDFNHNIIYKKMLNINIWEKFKQIYKIGYGAYDKVYKVQNIETGNIMQ